MKTLENSVKILKASWKIPRESVDIFFEGHMKAPRNYMRKQFDK